MTFRLTNTTLTSSPTVTNGIAVGSGGAAFATVTDATATGFATVTSGNVVRYTAATTLPAGATVATTNYKTNVNDAGYSSGTITMSAE